MGPKTLLFGSLDPWGSDTNADPSDRSDQIHERNRKNHEDREEEEDETRADDLDFWGFGVLGFRVLGFGV